MMRVRAILLAAVAAASASPVLAQSAMPAVTVLSAADVQHYRQIFRDERDGYFADAQAQTAQLTDRSLIGYAQAAQYLSPYARASVAELVSWLQQYRDLPIADRIYRLAVDKATVRVKRHHRVVAGRLTTTIPTPAPAPRARGGGYEDRHPPDQTPSTHAARPVASQ